MNFQPRPTVYKGIPMRSRLEAKAAAHMDAAGWDWRYEPRAYAGDGGQYLPDFEILGYAAPLFVEVKPTRSAALAAMSRMSIIWQSEPTAVFIIFVGDGTIYSSDTIPDEWLHQQTDGWAMLCQP